ncbi:MAG TPA: DUF3307 domain-containing protein [Terriglobales bacterium]|nr:DUF3307 domain-containing protein [Terriglobales bacterium]
MQPFLKFALTVLLAHLLGDFPLQFSSMVRGKGPGSRAYFAHGGLHFLVLTLCIAIFTGAQLLTSRWFWIVGSLYITVHLLVDLAKQGLLNRAKVDTTAILIVDQVLHVCTIVLFAWFFTRPSWPSLRSQFSWSGATGERVLEAAIVYVAVVFVGGYLIRYLTRSLTAGIQKPGETTEQITNAGMYIGWLERFLVLTAIIVQSPSMVGLILTAKSIARFPELKERFAEYFLIGSLLSVGLAVLGGLVLTKLWYGTISLK